MTVRRGGPGFLAGGGETGALMRAHDWSASPLGPTDAWPQPLRTLVSLMLAAKQPMFVAWGSARVILYNDPYAALMGRKHPAAFGGHFFDAWPEIRDEITPLFDRVFAGEPVHMSDISLTLERYDRPDEAHFAFSYTPIIGEDDEIAGLFCACLETTAQVFDERRRAAETERMRAMFEQAPGSVAILRGPGHVFEIANPAYLELAGRRDLVGRPVREVFPDLEGQAFFEMLDGVYRTGKAVVGTAEPVTLQPEQDAPARERRLDFVCQPLLEANGAVGGIFVQVTDVTERISAETALSVSEARNRQILDSAVDYAIIATDLDGRVTLWNRGAERILGWTEAEMLGELSDRFFTPEDRAGGRPATEMDQTLRNGVGNDEHWYVRKSGERFWAIGGMTPLRNAAGQVTGFVRLVRDRTEQRLAESRLRTSEERFRILAEASPGFVWTADAAGLLTYTSPRWHEYSGAHPDQSNGEGWAQFVHPDDQLRTWDAWTQSMSTGDLYETEFRLRSRDGAYRWWLARALPVRNEIGGVALWAGVCADVDAIVAARESLARSRDELEAQVAQRTADRNRMWRLSTDVMVVARFDATITAVNPAWLTLLGWDEDALLGRHFMDLVHSEDIEPTLRAVGRLEGGETVLRFENRYRHKDGSYRWLSWTAVPDDRFIHAVGRDVTADKEQAAALAATEEALRQSQKMEAVGQLTGGLAHDFNNLLTGISGSLELVQSRVSQGRLGEVERFVSAAQGAARRAASLTHRLLAFSRRQTLDPKPTDLNRLVAGMEELVSRTVGPEITIEVAASTSSQMTLVDPGQLENALLNLCINARDAMPRGGRLMIETGDRRLDFRAARDRHVPVGHYVTLSVSDNGTGMPPEVIARAFDPFFTTKPIGMGTGLGLSMIYGFARQSGGQVRIDSEVGTGTTVTLYLPRYEGAGEVADADVGSTLAPPAVRGETVLVVDDEPTVRMLIVEVLEDMGCRALEAADGAAALELLRSDVPVDLLVTDVGLPGGINGRQLADAARMLRPGLRVLFITGYAEQAALSHGHLQPGMHVLTKPFAIDALASRIRELIASAGP